MELQDPRLVAHPTCKYCGHRSRINEETGELPAHACPRGDIRPTFELLARDAASVVEQITQCWDGDVEAFVLLVPKREFLNQTARAPYGTTLPKERLIPLLRAILEKLPDAGSLTEKLRR
jgi:hypothetical protein